MNELMEINLLLDIIVIGIVAIHIYFIKKATSKLDEHVELIDSHISVLQEHIDYIKWGDDR